jgi:hypothetical protein
LGQTQGEFWLKGEFSELMHRVTRILLRLTLIC